MLKGLTYIDGFEPLHVHVGEALVFDEVLEVALGLERRKGVRVDVFVEAGLLALALDLVERDQATTEDFFDDKTAFFVLESNSG